jgi:hypothetical protein
MTRFDKVAKSKRPNCVPKAPAKPQRSVEEMLHEIAYVLHLTRKVKAEILEEADELLATPPKRLQPSVRPDLCVAG